MSLQRRLHISNHATYPLAQTAKTEELEKNPDWNLQIRKHADTFELVVRLSNTEAKQISNARKDAQWREDTEVIQKGGGSIFDKALIRVKRKRN